MIAFNLQESYEKNIYEVFRAFFNVLMGDSSLFDEINSSFSVLIFILYVIACLALVVIMMNLIIAFISDNYSEVSKVNEMANSYERLNILVDLEEKFSPSRIYELNLQMKQYLVAHFQSKKLQDEQILTKIFEEIARLSKNLNVSKKE